LKLQASEVMYEKQDHSYPDDQREAQQHKLDRKQQLVDIDETKWTNLEETKPIDSFLYPALSNSTGKE